MCLVAMGNSKGIVKRLKIETIDAAKYLIIMRYEFNDYRKLYDHISRNAQMFIYYKQVV